MVSSMRFIVTSVSVIRMDVGDDDPAALGGEAEDGLHHRPLPDAHGADDLVAHVAPGLLLDEREGLLDRGRDVGGAEGGGEVALQLDRVDGEDHFGAGEAGALHRRGSDAADADHGHVVARLHVGRVDRRAPAGGDATADEAGLVERDVVEDLHAGRLVDHRVRGEGAEADHGGDVLAPGVVADGAVDLLARHENAADVAQVRMPGGAGRALATGGDEAEHHVVARNEAR